MLLAMSAIPSILLASILWSVATQFYAWLGKQMNIRRLNFYKSVVSLFCFFALCFYQQQLIPPSGTTIYLLFSGLLGFALGDLCIFYSFSKMGAARTLMIASFVPAILAVQSYLFLGLSLHLSHAIGLALMISCIFFLSLDKLESVKFDRKIVVIAIFGFCLDAAGVILSKKAFMLAPELGPSLANMYRILVAVIFLGSLNLIQGVKFAVNDLSRRVIFYVILSSFLGTFLALLLWLNAIGQGHPATLSALGGLAPVYGAIYEYAILRRHPSKAFIMALISRGVGVYVLVSAGN